jgi:hypothetical protein
MQILNKSLIEFLFWLFISKSSLKFEFLLILARINQIDPIS